MYSNVPRDQQSTRWAAKRPTFNHKYTSTHCIDAKRFAHNYSDGARLVYNCACVCEYARSFITSHNQPNMRTRTWSTTALIDMLLCATAPHRAPQRTIQCLLSFGCCWRCVCVRVVRPNNHAHGMRIHVGRGDPYYYLIAGNCDLDWTRAHISLRYQRNEQTPIGRNILLSFPKWTVHHNPIVRYLHIELRNWLMIRNCESLTQQPPRNSPVRSRIYSLFDDAVAVI